MRDGHHRSIEWEVKEVFFDLGCRMNSSKMNIVRDADELSNENERRNTQKVVLSGVEKIQDSENLR